MKHILKVLIPLVLVLALLAGACWFFLFERTDLTSDFLMQRAEKMTAAERFNRAIRYYNWAWKLSPERSDIPLELSKTYTASGNYTKAEYTLVSAISAAPTNTDLYVALCQTYVVQDKLLDAVQMLDRTTDETVRASLDAQRPKAPVISPESGYYTDYIDVTVEADAPKIYVTTDGDYPSMEDDLYTGALTMPAGETTVIAIAVNDLGLVSPVSISGFLVGGVIEPVTLTDPAIDAAVREQLELDAAAQLMTDQLWKITALALPEGTKDLSDLAHFTGLRSLTAQNLSGLDFSPLSNLTALEQLDLSGTTLSTTAMQAISSLVNLRCLVLDGCALTDLNHLAPLVQLRELNVSNNFVDDIGVVSLMLNLETISLANNPLSSIAGLTTCANLKSVDLTNCKVISLASLSGKQFLETLRASNNQIMDLSVLEECESLSVLDVQGNRISDISVLTKLPKLTQFIGNNNQITEIPQFDPETSELQLFNVNYNQISDITGLVGLKKLNYLYADYNSIDNIGLMAENYNLIQVNVWDNPVTEEDVAAMQEYSIIVHYNPNYEPPVEEEKEDSKKDTDQKKP